MSASRNPGPWWSMMRLPNVWGAVVGATAITLLVQGLNSLAALSRRLPPKRVQTR
ncbi:hypothetical protein [Nonomuraea sp. NPDC049695]|uniref:hypothetical protein n=1 Tax=Nonomuraea sp. NPDC049695 TaxID=3154734 RepID=UPI00342D117A